MTKHPLVNLPHSIRERLLRIARSRGEEFQKLLVSYALERWLYRLSQSAWRERFVLKGAMLFALWTKEPHRATQDLDLLGYGENSLTEMERVFREISAIEYEADGLSFLPETIRASLIREDRKYEGARINLLAMLGNARIPLQIDVGFGDVVIPPPFECEYPTLLDLAAPVVRAYQRETVIAEKLHAIVEHGIGNSRMKDYFDLRALANSFAFSGETLAAAISSTFARRQTPLPLEIPTGLSEVFSEHPQKQTQWRAFVRRNRLAAEDEDLGAIVSRIHDFLFPLIQALAEERPFTDTWFPEEGWRQRLPE